MGSAAIVALGTEASGERIDRRTDLYLDETDFL
jgi:hypothetical protein